MHRTHMGLESLLSRLQAASQRSHCVLRMATETHSKRFGSDWHGDGLNVQPERLKRFYGAKNWFMGIYGSKRWDQSIKKEPPIEGALRVDWGGYSRILKFSNFL